MKVCKYVLYKNGAPELNLVYRAETVEECQVMAWDYLHRLISLFPQTHWKVEPVEPLEQTHD